MITILDYGASNIGSVFNAFKRFVDRILITSDPDLVARSDKLVVPGVGSFGDCVRKLRKNGLEEALLEFIKTGKPLLGICVGLHVFLEESEEAPRVKGLGVLKGRVLRFPRGLKVPHMGWNTVRIINRCDLLRDVKDEEFFYFVHSYYAKLEEEKFIVGVTNYGLDFPSVIKKDNIYPFQFHPEKSYIPGLKILENFCKIL